MQIKYTNGNNQRMKLTFLLTSCRKLCCIVTVQSVALSASQSTSKNANPTYNQTNAWVFPKKEEPVHISCANLLRLRSYTGKKISNELRYG